MFWFEACQKLFFLGFYSLNGQTYEHKLIEEKLYLKTINIHVDNKPKVSWNENEVAGFIVFSQYLFFYF